MTAFRKTFSSGGHASRSACRQTRQYSAPVDGSIPAAKQKYVPTTGTYPKGFLVSGTHVGVKASNTRFPDLALLTSERPASAAAVFTQNIFQAAPVTISRNILQKRSGEGIRSVIINSGCANAVTGKGGLEDATSMAASLDGLLPDSSSPDRTLVMSTGVIGQRLPIKKILQAVPKAVSNLENTHDSWLTTARSICTTDTFPKLLSMTFTLPSSPTIIYSIAGMTKGAGMIHPNMATLLGILCTDAPIPASTLRPLLTHAVERSFNAISIDGSTSTNDTLAVLANGAAGGQPVTSPASEDGRAMQKLLTDFTQQLSQLVVRDGEGATKFVRVKVINSPSFADTKLIASSIARDPLVKTALYGKDANWGRILCAIGYTQGLSSSKTVVPARTSVSFVPTDGSEPLKLVINGEPEAVDEMRAAQLLAEEDLEILVDLGGGGDGTGKEEASYWFCDFSHEYVTINGDYRT
ncbi:hypothetical protein HO133_000393 [Letharia lupina]|uniref:Arginine biosynthesis bifunctional protein ArgJ, mitochondrial n=1 Tax=Letharia lupina TaxID=560253 RepID=A0A8H6FCR4_9LECA|nr:uncharacterized protein HO133_000393 [Letharia lupina]KAF6223550.1 hypothetical protein HO133_000393 [Letharia lupina]